MFRYSYEPFKDKFTWKVWKFQEWKKQLSLYYGLGWNLIPIRVRSKRPLADNWNYASKAAEGPYIARPEAEDWVFKDFNLAVVAGPSGIIICDIDKPILFNDELLEKGLVMKTARGYAIPLRLDASCTAGTLRVLKELGYDFRQDVAYELVPLSVTCTHDHGKVEHYMGKGCVDGKPHDYRVREWVNMGKPLLSFAEFTVKTL